MTPQWWRHGGPDDGPTPPPSIALDNLASDIVDWIMSRGGAAGFADMRGTSVLTPYEGYRIDVCLLSDDLQQFFLRDARSIVATIVFRFNRRNGASQYIETRWRAV